LYHIVWADYAVETLQQIAEYIEIFDPDAAQRLAERIIFVADSLSEFPNRGREVGDNLREITTLSPYIIRYRVMGHTVEIIRIRHSARLPAD
jgi:toxin ParE1/3/4